MIYEQGHYSAKAFAHLDAYRKRILDLRAIDKADAVLIYREAALIGPAWIERYVARKKPIIYQLDDPLYVPYRSPFQRSLFLSQVLREGREDLRAQCGHRRELEAALRVRLRAWSQAPVRDPLPGRRRRILSPSQGRKDRLRIGWTGSTSTIQNLAMIEGPLRSVATQTAAEMRVIGAQSNPFADVPVTAKPWSAETEVEEVSQFDIGFLPIPRTPWNERKFFMKLSQYMTLGVPAVATPMGAVEETMREGETGFTARTNLEWEERLLELVQDDELRHRMSKRSAEIGASKYTVQANADLIIEALRAAIEMNSMQFERSTSATCRFRIPDGDTGGLLSRGPSRESRNPPADIRDLSAFAR